MEDSTLKKEWSKNDVQRARNLITGNSNDKTTQGVGYSVKEEFHKEGDIWDAKGKTWTIKDGIKQNITKLDSLKKLAITPTFCPSCKSLMKHRFDNDYYKLHKMCFGCVIQFENDLKANGVFEEYYNRVHNGEIDNLISEFELWVEEAISTSNDSFISEQGDIENWVGKPNEERVNKGTKQMVDYLKSLKINNDK
tara:strand:+ start:854 stop:1438 length:585 start_codon:yes stop_codon:yes gene_type:complete